MAYPVSVCGLLASPSIQHYAWQTAFYHKELIDMDPCVAKEFIELDIDSEGLVLGYTDVDLLIATLHPGHIESCPRIDFADQEVDADLEYERYPVASTFTVCGIFEDTGQCFSGLWVGNGPRMAYAAAYHHYFPQYGGLLVAAVHEGVVERVPESPVWSDPSCKSEAAMRSRLVELIPGKENHQKPSWDS